MKLLLASITRKIIYIIATCVIIFSLLVIVSSFFSPVLNKHKTDLEQWASGVLGVPVTIHDVQLSWHRYQPEISLNEVTLLNKDSKKPILQIRNLEVLFSLIQSIWQRQPVPSGIIISGSNLTIQRAASGEISIQGFPVFGGYNEQPFAQETKMTEMMAWLTIPSRIVLYDINIRYSDFTSKKQFLTLNNLSLHNDGDKHTVLGQAILHQDIATFATVAIQWIGNPIDLTTVKARIYLYVSGVLLSQWVKSYSWNGWQINDGILSAKIWGTWDKGMFKRIQVNFQSYGVDLYSQTDQTIHKVNRLSGHVGWKRDGDRQIIAGEDILLDLPSRLWPVTNFYAVFGSNQKNELILHSLKMGYLDLQDVQSFLFSSPKFLSKEIDETLNQLKLSGGLQHSTLEFPDSWKEWDQISLSTNFRELNFLPWKQLPGVRNLSGSIKWDGKQGNLSFQSNRLAIEYSSLFKKPIIIDQLTGNLEWQQDEKKQWFIKIPGLSVLNNDGTANMRGSLLFQKSAPVIDLTGHFVMQKADHIVRYLPMRWFDAELETWLKQAFLGGDISSGNVVLRGALNEFPFDKGNGTFLATAKVNNLTLNYAPSWPRLHHINGQVTFTGRKMLAVVDQAVIKNISVKNIRGEIPYLGDDQKQFFNVSIENVQTNFTQALRLIHASPLEDVLGKLFSNMGIRGRMNLNLGLVIPLKDPEKIEVKGVLGFPDAQLKLPRWGLVLKHLVGNVNFTEALLTAKNIQGQLFNKPVQIDMNTLSIKNETVIRAELGTNLAISDLENWLKIPFASVAQGATDVLTTVSLSKDKPLEISLRTHLVGVSLKLPTPYQKTSQETKDFSTDITVSADQPLRLKLIYSNLLSAALIVERKNETFKLVSADFRLGGGEPTWPTSPGLFITGNFAELNWDTIKQQIDQADHANLSGLILRHIDITAQKLDMLGQPLSQVRLQVTPESIENKSSKETSGFWKIEMSSTEVAGHLLIPMKWDQKGLIDAQFERLSLHSKTSSTTKVDIKSIPAISLTAKEFRFDDMPFGEILLKTSPDQHGIHIQSLRVISPVLLLQARGYWNLSNKTHLQGNAESRDISALINNLGLDARNFVVSNGKVAFDLNWRGAPYAPSLATLSGSASLNLGKGRVVEVGQSTEAKMGMGRMLSIFSLQTIPRRLTFDFSDLFQKGYSFDNIRGDFDLNQGNAYTTNLRFDGPVARVSVNGRIGLYKKDYDFTLSVMPYVSSGLPVATAGFLAGGPIGGAAALAVSTVLGPAVSKAATYYYLVKGPWDNPTWSSVNVSH